MYELCQHLLASGRRCTQPAVSPTPYCRHHGIVKRTVASSILPPQFHHLHRALPFLYPEDRASITANCFLVMRALDDRRISTQTANAMNRLLRTCQANLKPGPLHQSDNENAGAPSFRVPCERVGESEQPSPTAVILSGVREAGAVEESAGAGFVSGQGFSPADTIDKNHGALAPADPSIVRRVVLTPAGEELAPPLEVWEEGEEPHHGESCPCRRCAAAPGPHHSNCRCGQCPATPENDNVGAPFKRSLSEEQTEQPSPTDVILSGVREADAVEESAVDRFVSGQGFSPADNGHENSGALAPEGNPDDASHTPTSTEEDNDDPYTFYEGDPIPADPYAAEESEEERRQDEKRRKQILDKHKDRLDRVEKTYLYTPQLADRLREEIQQIMELEMGHEAFSYQPIQPPAS